MYRYSIVFLFYLFVSVGIAQPNNSEILMTIGEEPVSVGNFIEVYNKNLDLVIDDNQKDFDHYLELFVNYKLKLLEAKALGYDQKESYKKELSTYKSQLSKSYMSNKKVTETLLAEAYDRTVNEVKAQHILVRLENEQDTLTAFNKITELRSRFVSEDFETLQKELHNGTSIFVEDLGYFSAFKMVYDFENAAFNTPIGEVSSPFRTQFGYHVVKVLDQRPSRGKIQVSHIMITNSQKSSTPSAKQKIDEIYTLLQQGENFEELAKQISDDKSTAVKGGLLRPFKSGEINSEIFVDTAFSLQTIGQISEPIQTQFGWHIIKLIAKYPVESFEQLRSSLDQQIKRDSRSRKIQAQIIKELKNRYSIEEPLRANLSNILAWKDGQWRLTKAQPDDILFSIEQDHTRVQDLLEFINKSKKEYHPDLASLEFLQKKYDVLLDQNLLDYKRAHLADDNPEYAAILQEYKDGLMLFDLMQDKIWNAAKNDSLGLIAHYQNHKTQYQSPTRIVATIARSKQKKELKIAKTIWQKGGSDEEVQNEINNRKANILLSSGTFDGSEPLVPKNLEFKKGLSSIFSVKDAFVIINIKDVLAETIQPFEAVKGQVISDYQKEIEFQWINALKQQHKVKFNPKILKSLKQYLQK